MNSSAGVKMNWTAYEPRIGLAWKVLGSDKTVVRAGYGIFHDSAWSQGAQGLWQNPPFFAESDQFGLAQNSGITFAPGVEVGCPSATAYCNNLPLAPQLFTPLRASVCPAPLSLTPLRPLYRNSPEHCLPKPTNFKHGMVQQFNANVERQFPGNVVLTAGYAGARGHHILLSGNDINTTGPATCVAGGSYKIGCNPDGSQYVPNYKALGGNGALGNAILEFGDLGQTTYNSLQIKAETKTPRYGLYALISYTYSRTYDNGLSDGLGSLLSAPYFPLPNWQKLDWGSVTDQPR